MECPFCCSADVYFERTDPENCRIWCNTCPAIGWEVSIEDDEDGTDPEVRP